MSMDGLYAENAGAIFCLAQNCLKLPRPASAPCLEHLLLVPASVQATTGWPVYRLAQRELIQQVIAAL